MKLGEVKRQNFKRDRLFESKFIKQIKAILGNYFILTDETADLVYGTDMLILNFQSFKCAVRLRRFDYFEKFKDEFTIRYKRPNGAKTEYQKIMDGYVDYMLYGFVDKLEKRIIYYNLFDLTVLRCGDYKPIIKNNVDDSSSFAVFDLSLLPQRFVLKNW